MAYSGDTRRLHDNIYVRSLIGALRRIVSQPRTLIPFLWILLVLFLAVFGPYLIPYKYDETMYDDQGAIMIAEGPSLEHPLGTTSEGYDVMSRMIYGARPTAITGVLGGFLIVGIGLSVALTAGFVGGRVDDLLMRITDVFYAIPLIPFAIVVLAFLGGGFFVSILIIGFLLWRGNARVIRSQVLQIRERPYVLAAKATGASTPRIIAKHIFPNIAPMAALFFAFGIGIAIIAQAGLAFIGVANPFQPSWGVVVRNAYNSGYMADQLAWSLTPGFLIAFTVMSVYMIGREFEEREGSSAGAVA